MSLESPDVRARALADPRAFLAQADHIILDEIQRAPELLSYVQGLVDEDLRAGRFIVTGSQNVLLLRSVSQTLAGRTALLVLHPFSLAELRGLPALEPLSLDLSADVDGGGGTNAAAASPLAADALWDTLVTGFFPPIHDRGIPGGEWLADYFRTYVERDLREVTQVLDLRQFETFMRLAAARTATGLNLSGLAGDVGVTQQTARRWFNALEIGYLSPRRGCVPGESAPAPNRSRSRSHAPAGIRCAPPPNDRPAASGLRTRRATPPTRPPPPAPAPPTPSRHGAEPPSTRP